MGWGDWLAAGEGLDSRQAATDRRRRKVAEGESLTPVWVLLGVMGAFVAGFTLFIMFLRPT